jgi:anti-anti-sigma regulatory factor
MLATTSAWDLDVQRGPGCLFVRLRPGGHEPSAESSLVERLWALLEQHFTYSLVLEMDQVGVLDSHLLDEIAALADRIEVHGGMLRLCGLSPESREKLHRCRQSDSLPAYRSRQDALFARCRPSQPR